MSTASWKTSVTTSSPNWEGLKKIPDARWYHIQPMVFFPLKNFSYDSWVWYSGACIAREVAAGSWGQAEDRERAGCSLKVGFCSTFVLCLFIDLTWAYTLHRERTKCETKVGQLVTKVTMFIVKSFQPKTIYTRASLSRTVLSPIT